MKSLAFLFVGILAASSVSYGRERSRIDPRERVDRLLEHHEWMRLYREAPDAESKESVMAAQRHAETRRQQEAQALELQRIRAEIARQNERLWELERIRAANAIWDAQQAAKKCPQKK